MRYFSPSHNRRRHLRPPDLYEYFVDSFWFEAADLEKETINAPLRGSHSADVVIIGGGFTGLSAGYNISRRFPDRKIVLLEGACCGYGASGRNGGFCVTTDWIDGIEDLGPEDRQKALDVSSYGLEQIKELARDHAVDCDLEENGLLDVAFNAKQLRRLEESHTFYKAVGLESTLVQGDDLAAEIRSPVFKARQRSPPPIPKTTTDSL